MALNAHRTFIQVKEKIYLGPNYVRIIFDCADVEKFKHTSIGDNNKIFIPRHDQTAIEIPDFDFNIPPQDTSTRGSNHNLLANKKIICICI